MGYHLTILRSAQGRQVPILLDEARRAAQALGWTFDDSVENSDGPAFVREAGADRAVLWHGEGELWTKNPDEWAIGEMIVLARALEARVRGDEFETYASLQEEPYLHADDVRMREEALRQSKASTADSMREQKRIRNVIVGFFVVLGAIAFLIGKSFEQH